MSTHQHTIEHWPATTGEYAGSGWAVCECGATIRIEGGIAIGQWHTCERCTHPWGRARR